MTKDYDYEFGPEGTFAWPGCLEVAERFIEAALYAKSSPDCLDDYFFYEYLDHLDKHIFYEYPEEEALELAQAAAKARQELFKDAVNWPLPYLVMSATYEILSAKDERVYMLTRFGDRFFWLFLCFDEPLFDMLRVKDWGKIYRNEMREGFKSQLWFETRGFTGNQLMWGSDKDQPKGELNDQSKEEFKEKPWFTCECFASHIYAEDVLRCLDLVGVDPALAHSAVDKVFKLQSLIPLYRVLSDDPSLTTTRVTVVRRRHRGEEGETKSPNKLSV